MKLIVGLGNPGTEYAKTRHNAGFMAIDRLADDHAAGQIPKSKFHAMVVDATIGGEKCVLMKPTTFMNRSGQAIAEAIRFYKVSPADDLLVLVDEVALDVGSIRLRGEGSPGGHNGLTNIQQHLGSPVYPRLRIGVGPRPSMISLHDFVLGRFSELEDIPLRTSLARAAEAVRAFVAEGIGPAMNMFNTKPVRKRAEQSDQKSDQQQAQQTDQKQDQKPDEQQGAAAGPPDRPTPHEDAPSGREKGTAS